MLPPSYEQVRAVVSIYKAIADSNRIHSSYNQGFPVCLLDTVDDWRSTTQPRWHIPLSEVFWIALPHNHVSQT